MPKADMQCVNAFARQLIQSTWQTIFRSWNTFDWASLAKHPESSKASLFFSLICPPIVFARRPPIMDFRVSIWNLWCFYVKAVNTVDNCKRFKFLFQGNMVWTNITIDNEFWSVFCWVMFGSGYEVESWLRFWSWVYLSQCDWGFFAS